MDTWKLRFVPNTYLDTQQDGRSRNAILQSGAQKWHLKVTYCGLAGQEGQFERRTALQLLIEAIDFSCLKLLEDTMTHVHITQVDSAAAATAAATDLLPLKDSYVSSLRTSNASTPTESMNILFA
jgi:hypothetical protein